MRCFNRFEILIDPEKLIYEKKTPNPTHYNFSLQKLLVLTV